MFIAGYNSPKFMIPKGTRLSALLVLALVLSLPAAAQWSEPAAQLARQIAAITGPGAVSLDIRNISSLPSDQVPVIRRNLQTELGSAGVRVVNPDSAAAEIKLTLSENVQGYVWLAEVQQGTDRKVAIVTAPRAQPAAPATNGPSLTIRKTPLWTQEGPILDVLVLPAGSEPHMVVLDPENVSLFKMSGGRWSLEQQLPVTHAHAWPRDIRGRLAPAKDHLFDAYLPGTMCASTAKAPLSLNCHGGDDPWQIAAGQYAIYDIAHNFFTGVIWPALGKQSRVPPFYSAAGLPRSNYLLWTFARTDGSVHLMDGVNDVGVSAARNWGSDIAGVKSSCGTGAQLLVTGAGDGRTPDTMRAFEVADREPAEVSAPVEFTGPVTALWPSVDGRTAVAVEHNLKTGRYDAFELAISCGQ
jgi:hypothetical protein